MTRKVFNALAKELRAIKPGNDDREFQWYEDVQAVANVCSRFNLNFDENRFKKARGYED
jgi:hypothetical protein